MRTFTIILESYFNSAHFNETPLYVMNINSYSVDSYCLHTPIKYCFNLAVANISRKPESVAGNLIQFGNTSVHRNDTVVLGII